MLLEVKFYDIFNNNDYNLIVETDSNIAFQLRLSELLDRLIKTKPDDALIAIRKQAKRLVSYYSSIDINDILTGEVWGKNIGADIFIKRLEVHHV
jgi:hypothetical protein